MSADTRHEVRACWWTELTLPDSVSVASSIAGRPGSALYAARFVCHPALTRRRSFKASRCVSAVWFMFTFVDRTCACRHPHTTDDSSTASPDVERWSPWLATALSAH